MLKLNRIQVPIAIMVAIITSPSVMHAQPSVTLDATSGPPGSTVTLVGTRGAASPRCAINISWNDRRSNSYTQIGSGQSNSDGSFRISFTVPLNAPAGSATIQYWNAGESRRPQCREVGFLRFTVTSAPTDETFQLVGAICDLVDCGAANRILSVINWGQWLNEWYQLDQQMERTNNAIVRYGRASPQAREAMRDLRAQLIEWVQETPLYGPFLQIFFPTEVE